MCDLILFGPPAVGKGSQAKLLTERYGYTWLSTGDIMRAEIAKKTTLGAEMSSYIDKGNFLPDHITIKMVWEWFKTHRDSDRIILDGFPRNIQQLYALENIYNDVSRPFPQIVCMSATLDTLRTRMLERANNLHRPDDTEEIFTDRHRIYRTQTEPLLQSLRQNAKDRVIRVNADYSVEDIHTTLKVMLGL